MVKFNENVIVALFDNSLDMNESIFSKYTENTKSTEYNPLEKVKRDIYGYEFEEGVPPPVGVGLEWWPRGLTLLRPQRLKALRP